MARSLDQIIAELGGTYDPQINSLRQRQALIPGQIAEEEKGLEGRQQQAFGDILAGARRRGTGVAFGGIPLGEQAKYTSTEFLPALARLKQSGREQAMSLEDAILGVTERRNTLAQQLRQQEIDRDWQREQFERQLEEQRRAAAASSGGFSPSFGGGGPTSGGGNAASATATRRADGGFNFAAPGGQAISAAAYAQAKGIPFRQLLQTMANAGDAGAKTALSFVGDDFGYDPNKVKTPDLANLYNSLVWGVGPQAKVNSRYGSGYAPGVRVPATGTAANNALSRGKLW